MTKLPKDIRPTDPDMIGQLVAELLDGHVDACERADFPSLMAEGYERAEINEIEYVAGDYSRIRITTSTGREFRIEITTERAD